MITYRLTPSGAQAFRVDCFSNTGAAMGSFLSFGTLAVAREHMAAKYPGAIEMQAPKAPTAIAPVRAPVAAAAAPAMTMAQIRQISRDAEIALKRAELAHATAPVPAPRAVDPRIVKAFGLQTPTAPANPCIQTFGAAAPTPAPVQLSRSTASTATPSGGPAIQARSSGAHSPAMQAKLDAMVGEAVLPRGVRNESHRQVFGVRS